MPAGFTGTLASRLDELSKVRVKEAEDGEELKNGVVYIAPGGRHLTCQKFGSSHRIKLNDDPPRDALRPCANIRYDSLLTVVIRKSYVLCLPEWVQTEQKAYVI